MKTQHANPWGLSAEQFRTIEALAGPAKGMNKRAALLLHVEIKTIDKRVHHAVRKMGCTSRTEAILTFDRQYRAAVDPKAGVAACEGCGGLGFVRRAA